MTRRQNGEGSITILKNGKVRVRVEVEPANGKRQWLSATADTKKEALKKLRGLLRAKEDKKYIKKTQKTYKDAVKEYLEYKKPRVKPTTYQCSAQILNKSCELLGELPIHSIKTPEIETLILLWQASNNSSSSIQSKLIRLKNFIKWAIKQKMLLEDPIVFEDLPDIQPVKKKKVEVLSADEHKRIREYLLEAYKVFKEKPVWELRNRMYPLYLVAYETGMRRGEILGLKWKSVDFEKNQIHVDNNLIFINKQGIMDTTPKSDAGFRSILISQGLTDILRELKGLYDKYGYKSEYVFGHDKTGFCPAYMTTLFTDILRKVGITRDFSFHDIRHTNASIMIHNGVDDAVITERLGHSSIVITLTTYAHVYNGIKQRQAALVDATQ